MANCQSSCGMEPKCILTSVPNKQNKNNKHLHIYKDRMPTSTLKLKSQRQISFHLRALSASWAAWTLQEKQSPPCQHSNIWVAKFRYQIYNLFRKNIQPGYWYHCLCIHKCLFVWYVFDIGTGGFSHRFCRKSSITGTKGCQLYWASRSLKWITK